MGESLRLPWGGVLTASGAVRDLRVGEQAKRGALAPVIDLDAHRCRGLSPRCREVMRRIRAGSDCKLCGDMGALYEPTNEPRACMSCGKLGSGSV